MITKIITIAIIVSAIMLILKLLQASTKVIMFAVWLLVVSCLIYLALPWLDPYLQKIAKVIPDDGTCYGLTLESGDCLGLIYRSNGE